MCGGDDGTRRVLFSGTETAVSFIAPGVVGSSGGLVKYELGLTNNRAGIPVLALSRAIYDGEAQGEQPASSDIRVPMPATRQLAFRYFGPQDSDTSSTWSDHWDAADILPQLVEITTVTTRGWTSQTRRVIVALHHFEPPSPLQRR